MPALRSAGSPRQRAVHLHSGHEGSEVEAQFRSKRSRRYVVRSAEGREKVIQGVLIRDVHRGQLQADLVFVAVENVVMAHRHVEQMTGSDAGRILVVIFGSSRRYLDQGRSVLGSGA